MGHAGATGWPQAWCGTAALQDPGPSMGQDQGREHTLLCPGHHAPAGAVQRDQHLPWDRPAWGPVATQELLWNQTAPARAVQSTCCTDIPGHSQRGCALLNLHTHCCANTQQECKWIAARSSLSR